MVTKVRQIMGAIIIAVLIFIAIGMVESRLSTQEENLAELKALTKNLSATQAAVNKTLKTLEDAIAAGPEATRKAIQRLIALIQKENDALLQAIRENDAKIIHLEQSQPKTSTQCVRPNGKPC